MASLVCRVDSTRWPVMAARMPISAVSWSRISPIRTMSGILAQHGAQDPREEVDLFVDLDLVESAQAVFDRVLDGDDLLSVLFEFVQRGVEGGVLPEPVGPVTRTMPPLGRREWRKRSGTRGAMPMSRDRRPVFWLRSRITTDSPYWAGSVEIRTSTELPRTLMLKRPSWGRRFPKCRGRHEFQAQRHGAGDLGVGFGLDVEDAVDAEADAQAPFLRLEMDVGGPQADGFLEHGLEELDHRGIFRPRVRPRRSPNSTGMSPSSAVRFLGQAGDLLAPVVDPVDQSEELGFGDHGEIDFPRRTRVISS